MRLTDVGSSRRAAHVLMLPDFERADRIGEFWGYPESRAFAELTFEIGLRLQEPRAAASWRGR
jgi:hypothetical protein